MGMTMTQKILAAHAGLDSVKAGQFIGLVGWCMRNKGPRGCSQSRFPYR